MSWSWTVLLPSDRNRKYITSITVVLLPFVTYLLTVPRISLLFPRVFCTLAAEEGCSAWSIMHDARWSTFILFRDTWTYFLSYAFKYLATVVAFRPVCAFIINWTACPCVHVRRIRCHHGVARRQVADGGDDLQIWIVYILNRHSRTADKGFSPSLGVVHGG
jgi:hypothetical protein